MATKRVTKKGNGEPKKTGEKGRKKPDSSEIPEGVKALLAEIMPLIEKGYPESTVVASIGLDAGVWEGYCTRYPALKLAIQKVRAGVFMKWQDDMLAGAQGWQCKATALERLDGRNWNRSQGSQKAPKASALARAVKGRR